KYLAHTEIETDYFALMVQYERAGTTELKKYIEKKIEALRLEALKLSKRISHEKKLSDNQRSIFYSSWLYSAVHLFTSTRKQGVTLDEIATRFAIPKNKL